MKNETTVNKKYLFFFIWTLVFSLSKQISLPQVTKVIHNLLQAAQKGKIESYAACAEKILTAVQELIALFPEVCSPAARWVWSGWMWGGRTSPSPPPAGVTAVPYSFMRMESVIDWFFCEFLCEKISTELTVHVTTSLRWTAIHSHFLTLRRFVRESCLRRALKKCLKSLLFWSWRLIGFCEFLDGKISTK